MKINSFNNKIIPCTFELLFFPQQTPNTKHTEKETGNYVLTVQFASFIQILFPFPTPKWLGKN